MSAARVGRVGRVGRVVAAAAALFLLLGLARGQGIGGAVVKRWPLAAVIPLEPHADIDGSSAGPAGVVTPKTHTDGACHEDVCNCFTSAEPHVFRITWCASTVTHTNVGCSLDVGYRSAEGARHGRLGWSTGGLNASNSSFTYLPADEVYRSPATSLFSFDMLQLKGKSGKNVIDTVFSGLAAPGVGGGMPLSATSGFCCRAEFSGGKTVTGTIYVGDLEVRAGAAAPSATPSATASPSATPSNSPSPSATPSNTASPTVSTTSTASASWTPLPPPAAGAAAPAGAVLLSAPATSGIVLGAALAGAAGTLLLQFVLRRLRGGGLAVAAALRGGAGGVGSGNGAGGAAARERAALLGRAAL
jgi:hypothetical protein